MTMHTFVSLLKSAVRMLGCAYYFFVPAAPVSFLAMTFFIAELIGIAEEVPVW